MGKQTKTTSKLNPLTPSEETLGALIYFHRKKSGLTQQELAKLAGVGKTVVYDVEKGKKTIQLDTLQKLLNTLNIQIQFHSPLIKLFLESQSEKSS